MMNKTAFLVFSLMLAGMMLIGGSAAMADTIGVNVAEKEGIGQYLTDGAGMTLYTFANDSAGTSSCTGECLEKWPAFNINPAGLIIGCESSDFGSITREDGASQTTYRGMPLYYFFNDKKPGDTNGQGVKGVWHVVSP